MSVCFLITSHISEPANDNSPHDPLDYEDFDPAVLPDDAIYTNRDDPLDVCSILSMLHR